MNRQCVGGDVPLSLDMFWFCKGTMLSAIPLGEATEDTEQSIRWELFNSPENYQWKLLEPKLDPALYTNADSGPYNVMGKEV